MASARRVRRRCRNSRVFQTHRVLSKIKIPFHVELSMHANKSSSMRMSPSGAQALAARNLDFLAAIERTIDALVSDTDLIRDIGRAYQEIQNKLTGLDTEIDADGRITGLLEKASEACVRIYRGAQRRHEAACQDPLLQPGTIRWKCCASGLLRTTRCCSRQPGRLSGRWMICLTPCWPGLDANHLH